MTQVGYGADIADDEIVNECEAGDLIITADIPLAARVVEKGALALDPRGKISHASDGTQARALTLPQVEGDSQGPAFDSMARYLKVHVVKSNGNKVSLTMPARCADDIEGVMDDPVKESIRKQNIDLIAIQDKARKSGFIPQVLFELHDEERDMNVWLE